MSARPIAGRLKTGRGGGTRAKGDARTLGGRKVMRAGAPCGGDEELWKANLEMPGGRWAIKIPGSGAQSTESGYGLEPQSWSSLVEAGEQGTLVLYEWLRSPREEKGISQRVKRGSWATRSELSRICDWLLASCPLQFAWAKRPQSSPECVKQA